MDWIRINSRTSIMPRLEKKYVNQTMRGQGRNFSRVCAQKEWTRREYLADDAETAHHVASPCFASVRFLVHCAILGRRVRKRELATAPALCPDEGLGRWELRLSRGEQAANLWLLLAKVPMRPSIPSLLFVSLASARTTTAMALYGAPGTLICHRASVCALCVDHHLVVHVAEALWFKEEGEDAVAALLRQCRLGLQETWLLSDALVKVSVSVDGLVQNIPAVADSGAPVVGRYTVLRRLESVTRRLDNIPNPSTVR